MEIKSKKRIGFDLDGVLIDHKKNRKLLAKRLGFSDVDKILYGKISLKAGEIKNSGRALKELQSYFDVLVISRRHWGNRGLGRKWLKKHFNFPQKKIFFAKNDREKGVMAKKLGVKVYLDDKISVLKMMPGGISKFLFDEQRVYKNARYGDIMVVHSMEEFFKRVLPN